VPNIIKSYSAVPSIKKNLTDVERRELKRIKDETFRMERNFWIRAMKTRGYTNVQIGKEFDLTESTVREILKKE
jgi:DNA-binding NarL/FixJ family response regulator